MPAPTVVLVLGTIVALTGAAPAAAGVIDTTAAVAKRAEVSIEIDPSTVEAGRRILLRAACPDSGKAATVRSDAFGRVTVESRAGRLARTVTIPANQDPRTFTVRLTCSGGETATATLHVVARTRPSRGPATGFGGTAADSAGGSGAPLIAVGLLAVAGGVTLGLLGWRRTPGMLGRRRRASG